MYWNQNMEGVGVFFPGFLYLSPRSVLAFDAESAPIKSREKNESFLVKTSRPAQMVAVRG
jgi:hypothetical protein